MIIRLIFLRETDKARQYAFSADEKIWIPRSVIKSCVKFPTNPPTHELNIEDWWWEKYENENEIKDMDDLL